MQAAPQPAQLGIAAAEAIRIWDYFIGSHLGQRALRVVLQFIDMPQSFRLLRVANQFHRQVAGSVLHLDLDQVVLTKKRKEYGSSSMRPKLSSIVQSCPNLENLVAPRCTWLQGEPCVCAFPWFLVVSARSHKPASFVYPLMGYGAAVLQGRLNRCGIFTDCES